jgi:hypothetical protein
MDWFFGKVSKEPCYPQNRGLCKFQIRSGYGGVMIQLIIVPSLESRSSSSQTDSGDTIFKAFLLSLHSYNQEREIWTGIFDFVRVAPLEVKAHKRPQTVLNGGWTVVRRNLTKPSKTFFFSHANDVNKDLWRTQGKAHRIPSCIPLQ